MMLRLASPSFLRAKSHRFLALFALALPFSPSAMSQAGDASSSAPKPWTYEVVSIKPDKPDKNDQGIVSWWRSNTEGFSANTQPMGVIMSAYGVFMPEQIMDLPEWAKSDQFDIEARIDPDRVEEFKKLSREERKKAEQAMMLAMLAERFHLKVRREVKEMPVYALVPAKSGPKLKETPRDKAGGYSVGPGQLKGSGIEMANLAINLQGPVGRLIVDKTALKGKYDIELKWAQNDDPNSGDAGPSIFTALEEQLGLRLESTKAPVDSIVIEHIERPSEN